jgi:acyl-CoA synthetase (AMP-forming)/AMP-acid ligase II
MSEETGLPVTYPALLAKTVAARGSHEAIVTEAEAISYAELDRRSAEMARALLALGAGKGARIGLMAPDGAMWLTILLGGLRIGALVTLVSTLATAPELAHILRNSDVQYLVSARRFLRHDYAETLEKALPGLADGKPGKLRLAAAPYLRGIWLDDADGIGWARPLAELTALGSAPDAPDAAILAEIEREVHPGDDAVIIYTSGSTSIPKAVIHSQRNVTLHPQALAPYFLITGEDRMMSLLPAFWLGGLANTLQVLAVGGTLIYGRTPDPADTLDALVRFKANALHSWGIRHQKLRELAAARGLDVEKVRGMGPNVDKTGQPIPPTHMVNMMGMSESFSPHSAEPMDVPLPEHKLGAAGRAVNGYERRVVDPETGVEVPRGTVGEMQIRGGALMSGFYKRPRHEVFTADGFYPTGDLAKMDEEDWVWFLGRRGDMIKTGTANVSRGEVEAGLLKLPGVKWAYAAGLPDEELGQRIVACVVPAEGAELTEEALKAGLKELISSYKIPKRILFIGEDEIRLTATGKLKLNEMTDLLAGRESAAS